MPRFTNRLDDTDGAADAFLVERIQLQRNLSALATLFDRHGASVYALVLRILGDKFAAEGITQQTFLDVWNGRTAANPQGSVETSLLLTARRQTGRVAHVPRRIAVELDTWIWMPTNVACARCQSCASDTAANS